MTMTPMSCDDFAVHLADHLEGEIDAAERAAMDAHAAACDGCGALLADLLALRESAAALPVLEPSRELWSGIAARIEAPVVELHATAEHVAAGRRDGARGRWWRHPALLAAGLVGITAGITHYATREAYRDVQPASTAHAPLVRASAETVTAVAPTSVAAGGEAAEVGAATAAAPTTRRAIGSPGVSPFPTRLASGAGERFRHGELAALDSLYDREIARLRGVLAQRRTLLDSTTVTVLERNMKVIDRAIAECRAALAADPASGFLNQQLNEALETKIELLRTAATMPIGS